MKKRVFVLDSANEIGATLHEVLATYIDAAYPKGGSPCATATREAFESLMSRIKDSDSVEVSTRQRPMLKAAVKWHMEEFPDAALPHRDTLLTSLERR